MAIYHINAEGKKPELIEKKTMRRICAGYETKLHRLQVEEDKFIALSVEEKVEIDRLKRELTKREKITYYVGAIASLVGAGVMWLIQ